MRGRKAQRREMRRKRRALRGFARLPGHTRYVDHPRYGDRPILSGERWTEAEIRQSWWGYGACNIFPETAISADIARQNFGWCPRRVYVDIARACRSCGRPFLFFALEQKFWFEELGFFVDAECHHCQDCRHETHLLRARRRDYDALVAKPDKTRADWERLERLGQALWEMGEITKPETLLKSRMPKRLRRTL